MTPTRFLSLRLPTQRTASESQTAILTVDCCDSPTPAYLPDGNDPVHGGLIFCAACDAPLLLVGVSDAR